MTTEVTVVIPTILRPELRRALESVRAQDCPEPVEVLVVADVDHRKASQFSLALKSNERMLVTGGGLRGGGARNMGVEHGSGRWIAYLDDDDKWASDHLSNLLAHARHYGWQGDKDDVVLASRARQVSGGSGIDQGVIVPNEGIKATDRVEDYLFLRRRPRADRASLFTTTILASSHLARRVLWDPELKRHQDWDWLLRAQRAGASISHVHKPTCVIQVGSASSISATSDWQASLQWVLSVSDDWCKQTIADFVAGQPLRYALTARSWAGVVECLRVIGSLRRVPSSGPLLLGAAGLVGRKTLERSMFVSGGTGRKGRMSG